MIEGDYETYQRFTAQEAEAASAKAARAKESEPAEEVFFQGRSPEAEIPLPQARRHRARDRRGRGRGRRPRRQARHARPWRDPDQGQGDAAAARRPPRRSCPALRALGRGAGIERVRRCDLERWSISAAPSPPTPAFRPDPGRPAGRARAAGPARPRRQGGRGVEWAGHRGARRDRAAAGRARVHRRGPAGGGVAGPGAPVRWPAGPDLAGRAGVRQRRGAGGLRVRGRGIADPLRGDRRGTLAVPGRGTAGHRAGAVRRRERRLLRHGRRRGGAGLPAADPADGPTPSGAFAVAGACSATPR